jgi:predicted metal-dependent phosphotriesterase family hydrolase
MRPTVRTVLGDIDPSVIENVLHHEHITSLVPGPWLSGGRLETLTDSSDLQVDPNDPLYVEDQVRQAVGALSSLKALGYNTVVDLSPYNVVGRTPLGENLPILQEASRRSGVHIVAGSAVYLEPYSPGWSAEASLDELTERFILDVTSGIGSSSVRAGILGEQATGLGAISPHEEKCLRAAARAHRTTGVSLATHTTHGTMALEQLEILAEEGADFSRVVIGHMDIQPDLDYVIRVLDTGVNIAFDTVGKQFWDFFLAPASARDQEGEFGKRAYYRADQSRASRLVELAARGYASQLLVSQDLTGAEVYLNPTTHGQWGYGYLGSVFMPLVEELGLSRADATLLVHGNPLRLLTMGHA